MNATYSVSRLVLENANSSESLFHSASYWGEKIIDKNDSSSLVSFKLLVPIQHNTGSSSAVVTQLDDSEETAYFAIQEAEHFHPFISRMMKLKASWQKSREEQFPNLWALERSSNILRLITPNRYISVTSRPSVEEGVCITLETSVNKIHIEVYNQGYIGLIISNTITKKIILNKDYDDTNVVIEKLKSLGV